jgi:hypothetical protein
MTPRRHLEDVFLGLIEDERGTKGPEAPDEKEPASESKVS